MREIVLDTETTGLDPASGHRIIEIGCVELVNYMPTGVTRQWYVNPERDIPAEAYAVHGISAAMLADKPKFAEIAADFVDFVGTSRLVIHNADFDMKFLNAELKRVGRPPLPPQQALDTVGLARRRFPGGAASLDALCRRFGIDSTERTVHGALLDSQLLAQVYLELIGGREPGLGLATATQVAAASPAAVRTIRPPRAHAPTPDEVAAHRAFVGKLKDPLWLT